jgi:hypothetical protein
LGGEKFQSPGPAHELFNEFRSESRKHDVEFKLTHRFCGTGFECQCHHTQVPLVQAFEGSGIRLSGHDAASGNELAKTEIPEAGAGTRGLQAKIGPDSLQGQRK